MAGPIDDLNDFREYSKESRTEVEADYLDIWNGGSGGSVVHEIRPIAGDFKYTNKPKKFASMFNTIDVYTDAALTTEAYSNIQQVEVKVGYGSGPKQMAQLALNWKGLTYQEAGTHWGTQAGVSKNFTMQKCIVNALVACMTNVTARTLNKQGTTANAANKMTLETLLEATSKFGADTASVSGIIMHSKPFWDFQINNLTANKELFDYPGLIRYQLPTGVPIIVIDNPNLTYTHNSLTKSQTCLLYTSPSPRD